MKRYFENTYMRHVQTTNPTPQGREFLIDPYTILGHARTCVFFNSLEPMVIIRIILTIHRDYFSK